jgi:protein-tyrosine phosphatase
MDSSNISNLKRIIGDSSSIIKLLDKDVADPWYTGNFVDTYKDIDLGTSKLINKINSSL